MTKAQLYSPPEWLRPRLGGWLARLSAVILALALALTAHSASANGVPKKIVLAYLGGVSNWGPTSPTGVSEIVPREGEVRLSAIGLPRLQGERYQLWMLNTKTGDKLSAGSFTVAEDGVAKLDIVLEPFPEKDFDLMLVTVESENGLAANPSDRRSIAGRFPVAPTEQGRPGELPRTGGETPITEPLAEINPAGLAAISRPSHPTIPLLGGLVGGLTIGLVGFGLGRITWRRQR
ncbi:MAG: hypothetical protein HY329_24115 [Chloroflexi bacterium]|nr:hypothetical protein [Chloroflexota bacterium]